MGSIPIRSIRAKKREFNMAVPNELEKALKAAYSYENRAGHEAEAYETWYIGSIEKGNGRIYEMYKDSNGGYWYKVRYRLPKERIITEEEAIFGHKLQDKNRNKKIAANHRRFAAYIKEI